MRRGGGEGQKGKIRKSYVWLKMGEEIPTLTYYPAPLCKIFTTYNLTKRYVICAYKINQSVNQSHL